MSRKWFGRFTRFGASKAPDRRERMEVETDAVRSDIPEHMSAAAAQVLENEAVTAVLNQMRAQAMHEFTSSLPDETWVREAAHKKVQAVDELKTRLEVMRDAQKNSQRLAKRSD